jgi:F-type H+-transporting ATPase subunit b
MTRVDAPFSRGGIRGEPHSKANSLGRVLTLGALTVGLLGVTPRALTAQTPVRIVRQGDASAGEKTTPAANVPAKKEELQDENYQYTHSATVEKLGSMLGMNPDQAATAFTIFNFLVMVAALGYLLLKTLPKTFRNRNTKIQKNLVDARTATEEATARLNSVEARLAKLDEQIAGMRSQAEADSAREEQRIKASVEDEKAKIVAAAESEIQNATTLARREIQRYAAELAIDQAAKKLVVSVETDRLLVESFAHRLGAGLDGDKRGEN